MTNEPIDVACTLEDGLLEISGVVMHRRGWAVMDVGKLWDDTAKRGENLTIPGRPYPLPNVRRGATTVVTCRLLIDGRFDQYDNATSNWSQGIYDNRRFLSTYVSAPTFSGDGTRTVYLASPTWASVETAQAHVDITMGERVGPLQRAALTMSFPAGLPF